MMQNSDDIDQLTKNLNRLEGYKFLSFNWNGNNAEPFNIEFIQKLIDLIPSINIQPEIFPTAADTIQFEWENEEVYLEIEIGETSYGVFTVDKLTEEEKETEFDIEGFITIEKINEIVEMYV